MLANDRTAFETIFSFAKLSKMRSFLNFLSEFRVKLQNLWLGNVLIRIKVILVNNWSASVGQSRLLNVLDSEDEANNRKISLTEFHIEILSGSEQGHWKSIDSSKVNSLNFWKASSN